MNLNQLWILLTLALAGLAGNVYNYDFLFGVNLVFGNIAALIALRIAGVTAALAVAALATLYTWVLWGHFYFLVLMLLEIAWVGWFLRRQPDRSLITADLTYWLCMGMPLSWLFYHYGLSLPSTATQFVMFKQAVNGLLNVTIAVLLLNSIPLQRWYQGDNSTPESPRRLQQMLATILSAFVLIPVLATFSLTIGVEHQRMLASIDEETRLEGQEIRNGVVDELNSYVKIVQVALRHHQDDGSMWNVHEHDHDLANDLILQIPELLAFSVISESGQLLEGETLHTAAFSAVRRAIAEQVLTLSNTFSDSQRGPEEKAFYLVAPLDGHGHYLLLKLSPRALFSTIDRTARSRNLKVDVIDGAGGLVFTSRDDLDFSMFERDEFASLWMPKEARNSVIERWREAFWIGEQQIYTWRVRVGSPLVKSIDQLQQVFAESLSAVLLITMGSLFIALLVAAQAVKPLEALTNRLSTYNPGQTYGAGQVANGELSSGNGFYEVTILQDRFRVMLESVSANVNETNRIAEELKALINTANNPIFGIDREGCINEWNQEASAATGSREFEALGKRFVDNFVNADHREAVTRVLEAALQGREVKNFEFSMINRLNESVELLMSTTSRRGSGGEVVGVLCVAQDITESKRTQLQMIQASKMATLGEMATGVAHELNQPLNVIRMAAGNLIRRADKGGVDETYLRSKLSRIDEQTARAAAIIDHMRMFGRKEVGDMTLLNPCDSLMQSLELMGEQLRLEGIHVTTQWSSDDNCGMQVRGYAIQLEQVFMNLLSNARDAVLQQGGERWISLRCGYNDSHALIRVEDSGGGIPEAVLNRVFEPFFTTKEVGRGTGLGLSVSYGIITEMGGKIEATNGEQGAQFTVRLPLVSAGERSSEQNRGEVQSDRIA